MILCDLSETSYRVESYHEGNEHAKNKETDLLSIPFHL